MNSIRVMEMTIIEFINYRIEELNFELAEQIQKLWELSHSPSELGFVAGRVFQINDEIEKLKYYGN